MTSKIVAHCPICNCELSFMPWEGDAGSQEICPCCGIQFGYEDAAGGDKSLRHKIYEKWNAEWIKNGSPKHWNPTKEQVIQIIANAKK
jgi:hypothetical protein